MTQPPFEENNKYIPAIDGLRAIAVLSVILFHANASLLPGGFSGVDVFFVISGYVVTASLARESQTKFVEFATRFYARRIVRIYPPLVVCLFLVGIASTLIITSSWVFLASIKTALSAFFGASNFILTMFRDGYFAPRVEFNPFTHTWSLAVEEQFYLVYPAIFFVWMKGRQNKGFYGSICNWLLAGLLLLSLYYSWVETSAAPDRAYYLLPSRFWELASGALLYKLHTKRRFLSDSVNTANFWILAGLLLICLGLILSKQNSFPFPWALLSVSGTVFAIAGIKSIPERGAGIVRILDNRLMVYIGKISYSLYLWHWPVFVVFRWTVGLTNLAAIVAAITLSAIMSILSFHFLEVPTRKSRFVAKSSNWQIIAAGSAAIAVCVLASIIVFKAQPYISLSKTRDKFLWYPHPLPAASDKVSQPPKILKGHKLFAVGDSHCAAYGTMFEMLKQEEGVKVCAIASNGSAIANLIDQSDPVASKRIHNTLSEIEKMAEPNDVVFLASKRVNSLSDPWSRFDVGEIVAQQKGHVAKVSRAKALQEADDIITRLENKHLIVIIDAPKPVFKSPLFRCSDWFNSENPVCANGFSLDRKFLLEYRQPVMDSLQILSEKHKNLIIWDPFPILCPSDNCSALDGDKPLFFDGDHLSAHGGRTLYPSFLAVLTGIHQ